MDSQSALETLEEKIALRAALFRMAIIAPWYLKSYQYPLYDLIDQTIRDIIVPNITRRFGKSTVCVVYAIEQAMRKKQHIRYATALRSDLEQFIEPIFDSVLEDCPEDIKPKWLPSRKTWLFPNGSRIRLVGLDKNPNGVRGNAIDILIIDEAGFVKKLEYIYKSIIVPATARRKFKIVFPSTPPESPEHFWAKELRVKAMARGTYLELTLDDVDDMDDEEKSRLLDEVGGKESTTAQREFFCKIIVDRRRAVASEFNEAKHVGLRDLPDEHVKWLYFGDGGGIRDKTVFLKAGYLPDIRKVYIDSELVFDRKTPTPKIGKDFINWSGSSSVVFDAPGQTRVDIAELGIEAAMPQKDEFISGIEYLNAQLHNETFLINPACTFLITTLKAALLTENLKDFERTEELGHCDAAACLIYTLRGADRVTDLRPMRRSERMYDAAGVKKNNLGALFK